VASVVVPLDSMGVSRTETKVFWDTTDQGSSVPVTASAPSHFRLWWSLETRADVLASSLALGVGLAALGALLLI